MKDTKSTNVHDDGLSPSVMKALATEKKLFSLLRVCVPPWQFSFTRDFLFLRALSVLRGFIFNIPKRGVGAKCLP